MINKVEIRKLTKDNEDSYKVTVNDDCLGKITIYREKYITLELYWSRINRDMLIDILSEAQKKIPAATSLKIMQSTPIA